jgi:MFS family permease
MDSLDALKSLGLELPSPAYLIGMVVFGLIGLAAWRYGRKKEKPRTKWMGIALCFYPYVVTNTWAMYAVGIALCAGVWFDRG